MRKKTMAMLLVVMMAVLIPIGVFAAATNDETNVISEVLISAFDGTTRFIAEFNFEHGTISFFDMDGSEIEGLPTRIGQTDDDFRIMVEANARTIDELYGRARFGHMPLRNTTIFCEETWSVLIYDGDGHRTVLQFTEDDFSYSNRLQLETAVGDYLRTVIGAHDYADNAQRAIVPLSERIVWPTTNMYIPGNADPRQGAPVFGSISWLPIRAEESMARVLFLDLPPMSARRFHVHYFNQMGDINRTMMNVIAAAHMMMGNRSENISIRVSTTVGTVVSSHISRVQVTAHR